jgi:hypothetical protein
MKKMYYQVVLKFPNTEMQDYFKTEFDNSNDNLVIIDDNLDKQLADDPLTLALLIALVMETAKSIGKETISWLFEWLKKRLDGRRLNEELPETVTITIKIHDKVFLFKYDKGTGEYSISESEQE